jgi:hypothetical protein
MAAASARGGHGIVMERHSMRTLTIRILGVAPVVVSFLLFGSALAARGETYLRPPISKYRGFRDRTTFEW